MGKLRAAILAAGRGVRMGGDLPKTLLPIGEHEPLLHYLLLGLKKAGVSDLIVITGHRASDVESFATEHWDGDVTSMRNPRFASWGNFHSVRVALDQSPGMDVLVVNSDVVVHPSLFRRVIEKPGDLVLAVEKRYVLDDEDMKVRLSDDRVMTVSKKLKRALSQGEYAGVSLVRPQAARIYSTLCNEAQWASNTSIYYEDIYDRMTELCDVRAAVADTGEYAEVDTPEDVSAAAAVISANGDAWAPQPA